MVDKHLIFGTDFEGSLETCIAFARRNTDTGYPGVHLISPTNQSLLAGDLRYLTREDKKHYLCGDWQWVVDEGCRFIFGGDTTDHGGADLTILRWLVEAKERQPDQVTLLAGNRDLNKIRFYQELRSEKVIDEVYAVTRKQPPQEPHWQAISHRKGFYNYIGFQLPKCAYHAVINAYDLNITQRALAESFLGLPFRAKQLLYLTWMLTSTMGAPHSYKNRIAELSIIHNIDATPWDALDSFLEESEPGGLYHRYLKQAQLGYDADNMCFIHGAITVQSFIAAFIVGEEPALLPSMMRGMGLSQWTFLDQQHLDRCVDAFYSHTENMDKKVLKKKLFQLLNERFHQAISEEWVPLEQLNPTLSLPMLAMGFINISAAVYNGGIVSCNDWNRNGDTLPDPRWLQFAHDAGLHEHVMGHIPQGDHPRILTQQIRRNAPEVIRYIWVDTTKKSNGIPNAESLRLISTSEGHECIIHQGDKDRRLPSMTLQGGIDACTAKFYGNGLIWLTEAQLRVLNFSSPTMAHILNSPWIVEHQDEGIRLTQKHGYAFDFHVYEINCSLLAFGTCIK